MSVLSAKVTCVNRVNTECNRLYPVLVEFFRPFLGQKIVKANGEFIAKIAEKIKPILRSNDNITVYHYMSNSCLFFIVKTWERVDESPFSHTEYHETHVNIGIKKDGFLVSFCDYPNYRADYTESEVIEKRKKIKQLNELLREAKYSLSPFPEY